MSGFAELINLEVPAQDNNNPASQQQQQVSNAQIQQPAPAPQAAQQATPQNSQQITASTFNNAPNFQGSNPPAQDQNETIQSLINTIASGNVPPVANELQTQQQQQLTPPANPQQQQQQVDPNAQQQQQQQATTGNDQALEQFMRLQESPDTMRDIKVDELMQRVGQGGDDGIRAMNELLGGVAKNTMRDTLGMMLNMMPDMVETIKASVMRDVNQANETNNLWGDFLKQYPAYAPYKSMVLPSLQVAMTNNSTNSEIAHQAVAQMFAGVVSNQQQPPTNGNQPNNRSSQAFDFSTYMSA